MKPYTHLFKLNCKVAIYVPSTLDCNVPCDNSAQVAGIMAALSDMFGGATSTPAQGAYRAHDGSLVMEKIDIVYSYCTSEQAEQHMGAVMALCDKLKTVMRQECITLEYNGQVAFI